MAQRVLLDAVELQERLSNQLRQLQLVAAQVAARPEVAEAVQAHRAELGVQGLTEQLRQADRLVPVVQHGALRVALHVQLVAWLVVPQRLHVALAQEPKV